MNIGRLAAVECEIRFPKLGFSEDVVCPRIRSIHESRGLDLEHQRQWNVVYNNCLTERWTRSGVASKESTIKKARETYFNDFISFNIAVT
jgi:hypothetical protein